MFNYCPAKRLTKEEPIMQPGWEMGDSRLTFGSGTQLLKCNKRCSLCVSLMTVSHSVPRIHSDHHDLGGSCAARCHDSHPGGESILIQSADLAHIREILRPVSKGVLAAAVRREGRGCACVTEVATSVGVIHEACDIFCSSAHE